MRAVAQSRDDAVIFHAGSTENLAAVGDSFDFIFTVDVIHHMTDRNAYFAGAAWALKPGGRLATVTDSENTIRGHMPLAEYFPETVAVELDRYPSIATLRADMTTAGFTAISEQNVSHRLPRPRLLQSPPHRPCGVRKQPRPPQSRFG